MLFLNTDGTVKSHQKISSTEGGFTGTLGDSDHFGASVASLGDLDLDGIGDLVVGAPGDDDGGAVWVLFLNTNGTVKSHQKISETEGGFTGTGLSGIAVSSLGDLDGDGIGDLAVGAGGGVVWVLFLNTNGTVKSHQKISETEGGFTGTGLSGIAVTSLGDLDGDGIGDLAVGAIGHATILFLDGVAAPSPNLGDLNCDGRFDGADIDPFFLALGAPSLYLARFPSCNRLWGDLNCDGQLNGADIDAFFNCLAGNCADCNANGIPDHCEALDPLAINIQPQDTNTCVGGWAILTVGANRAHSYQWRKNGVEIPGATSYPLVFGSAQLSDTGDYDVIVADACVSLLSDVARLTVNDRPAVNQHPQNQALCLSDRLVLMVGATGGELLYQWRKNRQNIAGATQATYIVSSVTLADAGDYDAEITNPCGIVRSRTATVTITEFIFFHPVSQTVCENDPVVFSVGAFGPSLTYQWRKDGVAINGATANVFVIPTAQLSDAGVYDVAVTSPECTQISDPATLTVRQCP